MTIGNSVARIGNEAFEGTAWYENQPNGLVYAGRVAYKYKGTMPTNTSITLKEGTLGVADKAFYECDKLTAIIIPEGVTTIGSYAFYNCSGLTSVTVKTKEPLCINDLTFTNRTNATLYVPAGSKATYEAADYWKQFKEIVEMPKPVEVTDISQMDNVIYIEPTEVISGNQAVLSVKMKNNVAIQTIQFDLYLPDGVTIVANEDQELVTASKARINKFSYFQSSKQDDGALRLLAQATTTNVPAGDGEICRVTVSVPEGMDEGDYPIYFKNAKMIEKNNTSHSPDPNIVQCKLSVLEYAPGDANSDGSIDAIDFNMVGNYILGNHRQDNFSIRAADFNDDGYVDAIDFNMVANYILYGSIAPVSAARGEDTADPQ